MSKHSFPLTSLLILLLVFTPLAVLQAAYNDITFSGDTNFSLSTGTLTVGTNSVVESFTVGTSSIDFVMQTNSSVILSSSGNGISISRPNFNVQCQNNSFTFTSTELYSQTITVTLVSACPEDIGRSGTTGGGGVTTPAMPTTTTGTVTVTSTGGGKTTKSSVDSASSQNTSVTVQFPANAVSASTEATISPKSETEVVASRPLPSGKSVIGDYVYDLSARAGSTTVSSFSKSVTLTFSYLASQVEGLDEENLSIFYWNEARSEWAIIESTVNTIAKTITATTTHFTYFVIMGDVADEEEETEGTPSAGLKEGDLIRGPDGIKVYIINAYNYKRHIFNPAVFGMYGHFSWEDIKEVDQTTFDSYTTSDFYRADGDYRVYSLEEVDEAAGVAVKHHLNMTAAEFEAEGYSWNQIFIVNTKERDYYQTGDDLEA